MITDCVRAYKVQIPGQEAYVPRRDSDHFGTAPDSADSFLYPVCKNGMDRGNPADGDPFLFRWGTERRSVCVYFHAVFQRNTKDL